MLLNFLRFLIVAVVIIPCSSISQNKILPTEIDLKSAYCLGVFQTQENSNSAIRQIFGALSPDKKRQAEDWIFAQETRKKRLQRYLIPRIAHLEMAGIILATKSGAKDLEESGRHLSSCVESCNRQTPYLNSCEADCIDTTNDVIQKIRSCNDISWLPY